MATPPRARGRGEDRPRMGEINVGEINALAALDALLALDALDALEARSSDWQTRGDASSGGSTSPLPSAP